jgi:hypothetical protein
MISCQNHKLPVECGRWQNIERNKRVCVLYQEQKIGDEYHYSMECHFLNMKIGHTQQEVYGSDRNS